MDIYTEYQEVKAGFQQRAQARARANPHVWDHPNRTPLFKKETIDFTDPFAPSSVEIGIKASDDLPVQSRIALYGLGWSEISEAALNWVADQGFPSLATPNLNNFGAVDESEFRFLLPRIAKAAQEAGENSEEWLCYSIYFRTLQVCFLNSSGAPDWTKFEPTFILGGLVRELEISHRNKTDALSRRKAKAALAGANGARAAFNQERRNLAEKWRNHAEVILEGVDQNRNASFQADRILSMWTKTGEPPYPRKPAKRTIQNWLSGRK